MFICCLSGIFGCTFSSVVYLLFICYLFGFARYLLLFYTIHNKQIQITPPDLLFAQQICDKSATCRSVAKICSCSAIDDVVGDRHANVCADVRVHLSLIGCVVSGCCLRYTC